MECCCYHPIWAGAQELLRDYLDSATLDVVNHRQYPLLLTLNSPTATALSNTRRVGRCAASKLLALKEHAWDMNPSRTLVRTKGFVCIRDLPWRRTRDPYEIWLSEVMLQQTQVARVETRWVEWLDRFPSAFALAEAVQPRCWQRGRAWVTTAVRWRSRRRPSKSCSITTASSPLK